MNDNFFQQNHFPELCYSPIELTEQVKMAQHFIVNARNVSSHYLEYLNTIYGTPLWNAALTHLNEDNADHFQVYIPFFKAGKIESIFVFDGSNSIQNIFAFRDKEVDLISTTLDEVSDTYAVLSDINYLFNFFEEHLFCSDSNEVEERILWWCDPCPSPSGSGNGCFAGLANALTSFFSGGSGGGDGGTTLPFFGSGSIGGGSLYGFGSGLGGSTPPPETVWEDPAWLDYLCSIVAQDVDGVLENEMDPASIAALFEDIDDEIYDHCTAASDDGACTEQVKDYYQERGMPKCVWFNLPLDGCCISTTPFEACADEAIEEDGTANILFNELQPVFEFSDEEVCWLWDRPGIIEQIQDFYDPTDIDEEKNDYVKNVITLIMEDEEYKFERFEELFGILESGDYLDDCLDDIPVSFWTDLASFTPPETVLEKLENMNGFDLQPLDDAASWLVNLDWFPVHINTMPTVNNQQLSPEEFIEYIRININDFVEGSSFNPIPQDLNLWNSSNALSSIITIEIPGNDGSVITSQHASCCWIFSTITAPFFGNPGDSEHPVSGNRQFGFQLNGNGTFTFFTKGVDRFQSDVAFFDFLQGAADLVGYNIADALWEGFQQNLIDFIEQHGGSAYKVLHDPVRPIWNNVKNQLKSNFPITSIPCE